MVDSEVLILKDKVASLTMSVDNLLGVIAQLKEECKALKNNVDRTQSGQNEINRSDFYSIMMTELNIASQWSKRVYLDGEYTIHNNQWWRCKVRTSSEPTEGAEWEKKSVADVIIELSERVSALENK